MSKVFGITGWKNSGKTTLTAALVQEFVKREYAISTIKHAHESFAVDVEGTDSFKHRAAGASEVAILSKGRWVIMHEGKDGGAAPTLDTMLSKLAPCDLILVEGFKNVDFPKLECILTKNQIDEPVWHQNKSVIATASDQIDSNCELPQFQLDDVSKIADYISQKMGLGL